MNGIMIEPDLAATAAAALSASQDEGVAEMAAALAEAGREGYPVMIVVAGESQS